MHDTALISGKLFSETYGKPGMVVIDIGGQDVNGSLRYFFENNGMKYIIIFKKILEISEKLEFLKFSLKVYKKYSCR